MPNMSKLELRKIKKVADIKKQGKITFYQIKRFVVKALIIVVML